MSGAISSSHRLGLVSLRDVFQPVTSRLYIAVLLAIIQDWKQPKYPSVETQINYAVLIKWNIMYILIRKACQDDVLGKNYKLLDISDVCYPWCKITDLLFMYIHLYCN